MIIGESKPLEEVLKMIEGMKKIVVLGCRGCVTVCSAGGEKEVEILSSTLRLAREKAGNPIEIKEFSLERQCDPEYLEVARSFIDDYEVLKGKPHRVIKIYLKYRDKSPVVTGLERVSRPGLRVYVQRKEIPRVYGGLGITILSTPVGVMTGQQAWRQGVGGELLCYVW